MMGKIMTQESYWFRVDVISDPSSSDVDIFARFCRTCGEQGNKEAIWKMLGGIYSVGIAARSGFVLKGLAFYRLIPGGMEGTPPSLVIGKMVAGKSPADWAARSALITYIKSTATGIECRPRVRCIVPESWLPELNFLKSHGFRAQLPVMRGRFGNMDGIRMEWRAKP